jgi:hypothetical protein
MLALEVPRLCPVALLVKKYWRDGKTLEVKKV